MLRDLRISGFRGFREFAMSGLGRVNLLVGTNNCGKTSVLEAIHMLSARGTAGPLWLAQARRGELVDSAANRQVDVTHLVHGHKLAPGSGFRVAGNATVGHQVLVGEFASRSVESRAVVDGDDDLGDAGDELDIGSGASVLPPLALHLHWTSSSGTKRVQLGISRQGGLSLGRVASSQDTVEGVQLNSLVLITTEGLPRQEIISMFERVVLTPSEELVLRALRTIEPGIERLASIGSHARAFTREPRGGLAMMVAGQRVSIGSMGDGIWRLLGIALALATARGSVLLVDEIDTGLHYSVLVDMWRLVLETARSLDVQVFATTHSRDCYEALAAVAEPGRTEISLQRIERGKVEAVAFSELEIRQAAERGLEVR
jgi:hypothetical protein